MAVKWVICVTLLLMAAKAGAQNLEFGFLQANISGGEGILPVTVIKEGENTGDLIINITPFTIDQFNATIGIPGGLPVALQDTELPDPAELTPADFDVSVQTVTFPPSLEFDQVILNFTLTDDDVHELEEGLFLVATIAAGTNDDDRDRSVQIRNGVVLIRITNDDMLTLSFSNPAYFLPEDDINVTDLVIVSKDLTSEVDLPLIVTAEAGNFITLGVDADVPSGFQLLFTPTDTQMSVDFELFEDNLVEPNEFFTFVLSLPADPPPGYSQSGTATVNILDDDFAVIGFEQEEYTANEGDLFVEVCLVLFQPADISSLSDTFVFVEAESISDTAEGNGTDYEDYSIAQQFASARMCENITLIDDSIVENTERFNLSGALFFPNANITFDPSESAVFILDDDGITITADIPTAATTGQPEVGFTQSEFRISESVGTFIVPFTFLVPADPSDLSDSVFITLTVSVQNGTALESEQFNFTVLNNNLFSTLPTGIVELNIIDDSIVNEDRDLFISLTPEFFIVPFLLTVDQTRVIIEDDDAIDDGSGAGGESTTDPDVDGDGATVGMGGDPHFSILLPTGQPLCFSIQGEHGFTFNLIANDLLQLNALFSPDAIRSEVTWIGELGIVVKGAKYKMLNDTKLRFVAEEKMIYLDNHATLAAKRIERIHLSNGKLTLVEGKRDRGHLVVDVILEDVGLEFSVRFVKGTHLDMVWKKVLQQQPHSHGLIGQFFRSGVKVDEARRLLLLPNMEPVPVMRKPVWHFMERDTPDEQLCWVAMNPGYQGKRLIEGHYLNYLVDNVLSSNFECRGEN